MTNAMRKIIEESGKSYKYMLLDRMEVDCKYFLGFWNRQEKNLWSGSVAEHIEDMRELLNSFAGDEKPEWLTMQDINKYAEEMSK